jgi:hypothetical protein
VLRESFRFRRYLLAHRRWPPGDACEAARRTLLSQGYAIARSDDAQVEGNKNFQPREDDHEQLVLRISCARVAARRWCSSVPCRIATR